MRRLAALLLAVATGLPAHAEEACPFPGEAPVLVIQLYFGQDLGNGRQISKQAWQSFVGRSVTKAFPDGFTVYDAYGQWRDPVTHRTSHDRTKIVEIAVADAAASRAAIDELIALYRTRFHQQSVGLLTSAKCGRF